MYTRQSYSFSIKAFCFTSIFCICIAVPPSLRPEHANFSTVERWKLIDYKMKETSDIIFGKVFSTMMESRNSLNVSLKCIRESFKLLNGLRNRESWAVRFMDSSAKVIDSLLGATSSSLGAYDECLNIRVTSKKSPEKRIFNGQYCLIHLTPPLLSEDGLKELFRIGSNLSRNVFEFNIVGEEYEKYKELMITKRPALLRIGMCVPSGCSEEDVSKILNTVTESFSFTVTAECQVKKKNEYSTMQFLIISYFAFIGLLVIAGTSFDIYCRCANVTFSSKLSCIVLGFSFVSNSKKLLDTNVGDEKLFCFDGIRVITCCWIFVGHISVYFLRSVSFGVWPTFGEFSGNVAFQPAFVTTFQVDTFFFLSAFLVAYMNIRKKNNFSIIYYLGHRIFRIIPTYFSFLMFLALTNILVSGPMSNVSVNRGLQLSQCSQAWWKNLLFIHNFYPIEDMCVIHTWYLSADLQLYIAALIILLPLFRWPSAGILLGIFGILLSVIYSGTIIYIKNMSPVNILNLRYLKPLLLSNFVNYYINPFTHAGIYCIGILTANVFIKKQEIKLSKKIQIIGWFTAFAPNLIMQYYPAFWNRGNQGALSSFVLYGIFGRICWGFGLAWVILCCSTGNGGIVNKILSWKAFSPLSRLTFAGYLLQPVVLNFYLASSRTTVTFTYLSHVWFHFACTFATFLAAFLLTVMIEMPFMNLQSIVWPRKTSKRKLSKCHQVDLPTNELRNNK